MDDETSDRVGKDTELTRRSVLRKSGRLGAFCGAAIGIHGGFRMADRRPPEVDRGPPAVIGHRGCAGQYPENTLLAVRSAAANVDAVEVDIRRCATGELVVIHDATVDRVTDGSGEVRELAYEALSNLSVLGTDQSIPLLQDVFEAVPESVDVVLDLKVRGIAADAVSIATAFEHDVLLTSFDPAVVREVHETGTNVPTGLIVRESRWANRRLRSQIPGAPPWLYAPEDVDDMVSTATQLGCTAIHPRYELCLRTNLIEHARDADLRVDAWTVQKQAAADRLESVGVDGLIADWCDLV